MAQRPLVRRFFSFVFNASDALNVIVIVIELSVHHRIQKKNQHNITKQVWGKILKFSVHSPLTIGSTNFFFSKGAR